MVLDPKTYGLHSKTKLIKIGDDEVAIAIDRKSRFIMKDGEGFLVKAEKIKNPDLIVSLEIKSPICSKTIKFLEEKGIRIYR